MFLQVCLYWVCRQRVCSDSHGFGWVPFQRKADKGKIFVAERLVAFRDHSSCKTFRQEMKWKICWAVSIVYLKLIMLPNSNGLYLSQTFIYIYFLMPVVAQCKLIREHSRHCFVLFVTVLCLMLFPQVGAKRTNRPGISTTDRGFPRARFRSRGGSFSSRARYYSGYTPPRGRGRAFRWADVEMPPTWESTAFGRLCWKERK